MKKKLIKTGTFFQLCHMQIQFHLSYNVYVTQTSQSVLSHNEFGLGRYSLIQDEEEDKEGVSIPCRLSRSTKQQFWIIYNTWKLKKKNQKLLTKSNHNISILIYFLSKVKIRFLKPALWSLCILLILNNRHCAKFVN